MVKKKIYYLYFKGNDYQLLSGNHSEEIKNIMNGSSGTQILTIGLTKESENATEFVVWGSSKEEVKELLETGIKNVLDNLIPELKKLNNHLIILANKNNNYIGMAICFIGFSTFYAKPLINIHDLTVLQEFRKQGVGTNLIKEIEYKAKELNCCKITLEVQEYNKQALTIYENLGFRKNGYNPEEGNALFLMKTI